MLLSNEHLPVSKDNRDGASVMERMLKRIRGTKEFPTISKYLIEINQKLSGNRDELHASELANVILKDYALTNKLLKLVNSAFYGLAAGKVSTVTRAVVVLGYENIRLATISLTLFEHFKSKSNTSDLKEAVLHSFWSGVLARDIAVTTRGMDPEEAFVCTMMGQLGKLLMIYYLPNEYRSIKNWMSANGDSENRAVKAVCGITYEDLGIAVARQWNFPPQICDSMQVLTSGDLDGKQPPAPLRVLASWVKELGAIVKEDAPPEKGFQKLLDRYQSRLKLSRRQLKTLLKDSLSKVQQHARALNYSIEESMFLHRLSSICHPDRSLQLPKDAQGQPLPSSASFQLTDDRDLKAAAETHGAQTPGDIIMEGIQEISEAMMSDHDINDIALMCLEILYRSLSFHRAMLFINDRSRQTMTGRFGYGHNIQRLVRKVEFSAGEKEDLFTLSMRTGKDLLVANAYDAKLTDLIPEWYHRHFDAPAFVFLPVIFQKVCIGAFYADRDVGGRPIDGIEHRHLSMLRNQLVLAIKYRRSAT